MMNKKSFYVLCKYLQYGADSSSEYLVNTVDDHRNIEIRLTNDFINTGLTVKGKKVKSSLEDTGNDIKFKIENKKFTLDYSEVEQLCVLLKLMTRTNNQGFKLLEIQGIEI